MSKEHYLSIFAKFNSEQELQQWYIDCISSHAGYGKPIFSWSLEDESKYRDKIDKLTKGLKAIADRECTCAASDVATNILKETGA